MVPPTVVTRPRPCPPSTKCSTMAVYEEAPSIRSSTYPPPPPPQSMANHGSNAPTVATFFAPTACLPTHSLCSRLQCYSPKIFPCIQWRRGFSIRSHAPCFHTTMVWPRFRPRCFRSTAHWYRCTEASPTRAVWWRVDCAINCTCCGTPCETVLPQSLNSPPSRNGIFSGSHCFALPPPPPAPQSPKRTTQRRFCISHGQCGTLFPWNGIQRCRSQSTDTPLSRFEIFFHFFATRVTKWRLIVRGNVIVASRRLLFPVRFARTGNRFMCLTQGTLFDVQSVMRRCIQCAGI